MSYSMLIVTWVGIIYDHILHLADAQCKRSTNIIPTHVKMSIEHDMKELFLKSYLRNHNVIIF